MALELEASGGYAGLPLADSVSGEALPELLSDSPAVRQVLELLGDQWLLPYAEGLRPEQAQVVWVAMSALGEDFSLPGSLDAEVFGDTDIFITIGLEPSVIQEAYDALAKVRELSFLPGP